MEITNEIKAKVFAQYLGCQCTCGYLNSENQTQFSLATLLSISTDGTYSANLRAGGTVCGWTELTMLLRPISAISDEDAIEVANIMCVTGKYVWGKNMSSGIGTERKWLIIDTELAPHSDWPYKRCRINYITGEVKGLFLKQGNGGMELYYMQNSLLAQQFLQFKGYDLPNYLLGGKTLKEAGLAIYENENS